MPLRTTVGLGPGDNVLDGDPWCQSQGQGYNRKPHQVFLFDQFMKLHMPPFLQIKKCENTTKMHGN